MMIDDAGLTTKKKMVDDAGLLKGSDNSTWVDKAKMYASQLGETYKQQGKGLLNSASLGAFGRQTPEEQATDAKQPFTSSPYRIGQSVGHLVPLALAMFTGGATEAEVVAKYGLDAFKGAIEPLVTGAGYSGMKSMSEGNSAPQVAKDAATGAALFGGLGGAGKIGESIGNVFVKSLPEQAANQYLDTPGKLADYLKRTGQPSAGATFLKDTKFGAGESQTEAYDQIKRELANNDVTINNALEKRAVEARTPNIPDVPQNYQVNPLTKERDLPALEYNPTQQQVIPPMSYKGSGVIAPPAIESVNVPERNIPFNGTRPTPGAVEMTYPSEPVVRDQFGVPVRQLPRDATKSVPVDIHNPTEPTYPKTQYDAFTRETPVGSQPGELPTPPQKTGIANFARSVQQPEGFPITGIKHGPVVDLNQGRKEIYDLADKLERNGSTAKANAVRKFANEFQPGTDFLNLEEATNSKRFLDNQIGDANHLKSESDLTAIVDAQNIMADSIRSQVANQAPEVAALMDRQHNLLNWEKSLLPQVSGRAPISKNGEVTKSIIRAVLGNRATLGLARGLQSPITSGLANAASPIVSSAVKIGAEGARKGLSEYLDKDKKRRTKWNQ